MNAEITAVWDKVQAMINGFLMLLPNIILSLIVFTLFVVVRRAIKRLVKRLTRHHRYARNLGMVLGRLATGDNNFGRSVCLSRQREGWPKGKSEVPKPRSISGSLQRLVQIQNGNSKVDAHRDHNQS